MPRARLRLPFSLFLALRYLKPKRTFVSTISIISVLGVAIGVTVLIVVISVMSGFDHDLRDRVLGMRSHILVYGANALPQSKETLEKIRHAPRVVAVTPYIQGPVLVKFQGRPFVPQIVGVDPKDGLKVNKLPQYIIAGSDKLDEENVIIGSEIAALYGIEVGDKITIYSPRNLTQKKEVILPADAVVAGIFKSGMYEFDVNYIFTSLDFAQELYAIPKQVHGYSVMTDDAEKADEVRRSLDNVLPMDMAAHTWMQLNRPLFSALAVEKNMMFFLLTFIDVVAAFGVMSTLITFVVQKTREVGLLKALGSPPGRILEVFLQQGMIIGAIGTSLGLGFGLLCVRFRNEFLEFLRRATGFEVFPKEIYNFAQLPAAVNTRDVAVICLASFVLCALAGLIPAFLAARLRPVEALSRE